MTKEELERMRKLDDVIDEEGGLGLDPYASAQYDYRAIIEYAQKRKVTPGNLTVREMSQFVVGV